MTPIAFFSSSTINRRRAATSNTVCVVSGDLLQPCHLFQSTIEMRSLIRRRAQACRKKMTGGHSIDHAAGGSFGGGGDLADGRFCELTIMKEENRYAPWWAATSPAGRSGYRHAG